MNRYLQLLNLVFWFALELSRPAVAFSLAERLSSTTSLGLLLSVQSLLPLLLAIPIGIAGDRLGARLMLPVGAALMLCSGAVYWATGSLVLPDRGYVAAMLIAQVLNGLAWLLVWIATQALVSSAGTPGLSSAAAGEATRKRVQMLALTASLGALAGPAVSGWLHPLGDGSVVWLVFVAAAGALLLLAVKASRLAASVRRAASGAAAGGADVSEAASMAAPMAARVVGPAIGCGAEPAIALAGERATGCAPGRVTSSAAIRAREGASASARPLYLFVMLASLVLFFGAEFRATFMPAYLVQQGNDPRMIGLVLTIGAVGVGAVRLLISAGLLRLRERAAVGLSLALSVIGIALLPLLEAGGLAPLAVVSLLLSVAVGIGEPVLILAVIRCAAPARRSLALAGRLTANRLAMLLAPLAAGAAIQLAGAGPGLLLLGLLLALVAAGAARLFWKYGSL